MGVPLDDRQLQRDIAAINRIEAVPLEAVRKSPMPAAGDLVFIVVGDRATLEPQLKTLGLPVETRSLP